MRLASYFTVKGLFTILIRATFFALALVVLHILSGGEIVFMTSKDAYKHVSVQEEYNRLVKKHDPAADKKAKELDFKFPEPTHPMWKRRPTEGVYPHSKNGDIQMVNDPSFEQWLFSSFEADYKGTKYIHNVLAAQKGEIKVLCYLWPNKNLNIKDPIMIMAENLIPVEQSIKKPMVRAAKDEYFEGKIYNPSVKYLELKVLSCPVPSEPTISHVSLMTEDIYVPGTYMEVKRGVSSVDAELDAQLNVGVKAFK